MLNAKEVIDFLRYCERLKRPRIRLCGSVSEDGDPTVHLPIFQEIGYDGKELFMGDTPGEVHVEVLIGQYNRYVLKKENAEGTGVRVQE